MALYHKQNSSVGYCLIVISITQPVYSGKKKELSKSRLTCGRNIYVAQHNLQIDEPFSPLWVLRRRGKNRQSYHPVVSKERPSLLGLDIEVRSAVFSILEDGLILNPKPYLSIQTVTRL
jgi:hypothetical protein